MNTPQLSLKVIACEVAQREICLAAAQCPNLVDLEFLPVGHHDDPKKGHLDLQARIDRQPPGQFDALLIGYGICNLMLNGLTARHTPLVIPRAHDCITLFMGSKERYIRLFNACPGTYYFTAGWLEFARRKALQKGGTAALRQALGDLGDQASPFGLNKSFTDLAAQYGEDNARYLIDVTQQWAKNYRRGMLVNFEIDGPLELREKVAAICQKRGWRFEEVAGDLSLLRRWLAGRWDSQDFLEVPPLHGVFPSYNDGIIEARPTD